MQQQRSFLDRFRFKSSSTQMASMRKELDRLKEELEDVKFEEYLLGAREGYQEKGFDDLLGFAGTQSFSILGSLQYDLDISTLQRLSISEGFFYIAVNTIAQTIASLPHKLEKKSVTFERVDIEGANISVSKENWIDASGEPEQLIFKYPNDLQTAAEFYWLLGFDLLGTGNCYLYVDSGADAQEVKSRSFHLNECLRKNKRLKSGAMINSPLLGQIQVSGSQSRVQGIYRINPALVDPIVSRDSPGLQGYGIHTPHGYFRFSTEEIIHLKFPNPADPNVGLAPIVPVLRNVMLDRFSNEHVIRLYKNRALLGGILKTDKKLSKDQITRMQRSFEQDFTGKANAGRTVVLPEGMDYIPVEAKPSELGLIDFIKSNREPILAAYKVPPIMIGLLDGATYANALIQRQTYFENAIKPVLSIIEQGLNRSRTLLPPEKNFRIRFDLSGVEVLQENEKDKADTARLQLESGLTINEVRQRVWKLPPLTGGEISPVVARTQAQGLGAQGGAIPFEAPPLAAGVEALVSEAQPSSAPPIVFNGPQVSSILEILSRVASGQLPRDSGIGLLINGFGLSDTSANAVMGEVGRGFVLNSDATSKAKTDTPSAQPDSEVRPDIRPTNVSFEERVSQLIAIAVNDGLSIDQAVRMAFERAYLEGFQPTSSESTINSDQEQNKAVSDGVGGLHEHHYEASATNTQMDGGHKHTFRLPDGRLVETEISGAHAHAIDHEADQKASGEHTHELAVDNSKLITIVGGEHYHDYLESKTSLSGPHLHVLVLQDGTEIQSLSEADLRELKGGSEAQESGTNQKEEQITTESKKPSHNFSEEQLTEVWKALSGDAVEKLVEERAGEVSEFFSKLKRIFKRSLERKLRKSWIDAKVKAEDSDDFIDDDEIKKFIKEEQKRKSNAIAKAAEHGFKQNLVQIKLKYPDQKASEAMSKFGAKNIKYVTETTRDHIRSILSDGIGEGATIGEMSKQITDYFGEQAQSRAKTISRTETLSAVSLGQDLKNQEFKKEYPEQSEQLMKVWITSRDDRVRGNPDGLYPSKSNDSANHWDFEGKSIPESEEYKRNLRFPRDPNGPPEEVINCRCAWLTFLAEDKKEILDRLEESPFSDVDEGPKAIEQTGKGIAQGIK